MGAREGFRLSERRLGRIVNEYQMSDGRVMLCFGAGTTFAQAEAIVAQYVAKGHKVVRWAFIAVGTVILRKVG